jgi:hypothetical protein
MDDFVLNVRQIANYQAVTTPGVGDVLLMQHGGLGGPFVSITPTDLVTNSLLLGGFINLAADGSGGLAWGNAELTSNGTAFFFTGDVGVPSLHSVGDIFVGDNAVATQINVDQLFDSIIENSVFTVNGRKGNVILQTSDILQAGAAPIENAHFGGFNTSPTPWDFRANDDQIATTAFVQMVIEQVLCGGSVVTSFNGRGGDVILSTADVNAAYANYPNDLIIPTAPNPALGDASNRIATTLFVDDSLADLQQWVVNYIAGGGGIDLSGYAPLASPNFSGIPTAPTAATGVSTGQLATTAFVHNAVTAATTGVASFNTRTGAVVLLLADVTGAGGAPLASPAFTGNPTAPTAALHDNDTSLATTAYVQGELAALPVAPVTSFNTRTGAIVLTTADVTSAGGAPINNPAFTGNPTAPTAAPGDNDTSIATTAFVAAAVGALGTSVQSFNSRTGAVTLINNDISAAGGALLTGPAFTGAPTAPTATPGTATTQLATTAFVQAAITAMAAGVTSFNTRTGAVTLAAADVTGVGGALLAGPAFTGAPTAPTALQTSNDTTLATTAFVHAAVAAGGVASFNSRTGAVSLLAADLSAVGGALLAGPTFTGNPTAPTQTAGDNSTRLATTAFVTAALASAGGVTSYNGRAGVVVPIAADITAAGGALLAGPTFTGVPAAPTATAGTNTTQLATTAFVQAAAGGFKRLASVEFKASGTWTKQANLVGMTVEVWGGGGGGYFTAAGPGGAGGGYARKWYLASAVAATVAVTVGGGGAGGTSGAQTGVVGGATTFAATAAITGNGGGTSSGFTSPGGTASGGDINLTGQDGAYGLVSNFFGPGGASPFMGSSGRPSQAINSGAPNSGGGGTSGGAAGAAGYCLVTEYYSV